MPIVDEKQRFRKHLDEASAVVATWEPWERHIFGGPKCGVINCPLCQRTNTEHHMPAEPTILSEKQITELEAEIAARDDSTAMESACGEYNCSCHDRLPALCSTVRHLLSENEKLKDGRMIVREDAERFIKQYLHSAQWEGETLMVTFENEALIAALIGDVE